MKRALLLKYGEIALRGRNRYIFEKKLMTTVRNNIKSDSRYRVVKEQGRILIESDEDVDYDFLIPKVRKILGVIEVCPCFMTTDQNIENLQKLAVLYVNEMDNLGKTFKVLTKRSDKHYPLISREVSSLIGGYILENVEDIAVDVRNPETKIFVELRNNAYIFANGIRTFGGLPMGSSGKGMTLLSSGIDSPVAMFLCAKRGVEVEAIYFHSPPYTSENAKDKVVDLAKKVAEFTGGIKLHVVNFTSMQMYLVDNVPDEKLTLFLKRAMLKIADIVAINNNCQCLITGDNVGQVASQTIASLNACESASSLPILRPLAGFDKQEIINLAEKIETFEISILPFDDCCTLFVPKVPETKPSRKIIERIEECLTNYNTEIENAVLGIEIVQV